MQTLNFSILFFLFHSDSSEDKNMRVGEKHYIRDTEEKQKGFFYLLVRSLLVGAPLKSSLAYFYLFFLTAILAEQQRLLLPDYVLHKKEKKVSRS